MHRHPMAVLCCLLLAAASPAGAAEDPPAGEQPAGSPQGELGPAPDRLAAATALSPDGVSAPDDAESDADDDEPAIQAEVRVESAELEQVREAEEQARLTDPSLAEDPAARAASRLGLESPLRLRLRGTLGREVGPAQIEPGERIAGLPEIDHDLRRLQAEYDIPIEVNEKVIAYVRFFQAPAVRKHFVKWLGRSSKYIPTFRRILREEGLPEDTVYLAMIESGFGNLATSRARAVGAWQFIPATGKRMGLRQDFWVDERRDPEKAARAAARYLKELHGQTRDWRLAWAGYNAGVGKIYKAWRHGQDDFWEMTRGRVLKAETKGYVPKLMAAAIVAKHPEAFGFTREEIQAETWQEYEEVPIPQATPLSVIAEAAEIPEKALLDLNPELRRTCTPPRAYSIKLPKGRGEAFARNWPAASSAAGKLAFAQHRVGAGESLRTIAKAYRVDQSLIARVNGLRPGRHVKAGTELVIPLNALARSQGVAFASAERLSSQPAKASRARRAESRKAAVALSRPAREVPGRTRATVHVRAGDSLWGIAQRFGVALDELCRWNGIRDPRRFKLQAGRQLVVYRRAPSVTLGRPGAERAG